MKLTKYVFYLLFFCVCLVLLLHDDDVGCSQTGHVGSGFGTCRRARGARRIVSAWARFTLCPLSLFAFLFVRPASHLNNHRKVTVFCFFIVILHVIPHPTQSSLLSYHLPFHCVFASLDLADAIRFHFYRKIVELEEELRVVGNNLKSLEVSEEKV